MGYSVYFKQVGATPDEGQWWQIQVEADLICEKYKNILCREFDRPNQKPKITESIIVFNGRGNDGHETFVLQRNMQGFNFCKTAEKPYTAAVKEILEEVNKIAPGWLALSADDDWMK